MNDGACIMGVNYTRNNAGLVVVPHSRAVGRVRVWRCRPGYKGKGIVEARPGRGWGAGRDFSYNRVRILIICLYPLVRPCRFLEGSRDGDKKYRGSARVSPLLGVSHNLNWLGLFVSFFTLATPE